MISTHFSTFLIYLTFFSICFLMVQIQLRQNDVHPAGDQLVPHEAGTSAAPKVDVHETPTSISALSTFTTIRYSFLFYSLLNDLIRISYLRPWLPLCLVFRLISNHQPKPLRQPAHSQHHRSHQVLRMRAAPNIQLRKLRKQCLIRLPYP